MDTLKGLRHIPSIYEAAFCMFCLRLSVWPPHTHEAISSGYGGEPQVSYHSQQNGSLIKGPDVLTLKLTPSAKQLAYFRLL